MPVVQTPVLFESMVDVEYSIDEPPEANVNGKLYPVTIKDVKLRGRSIELDLHVSHILMLQRRLYIKLVDEGVLA